MSTRSVAVAALFVLAACGGGGSDPSSGGDGGDGAGGLPERCERPPVTMRLEAGGTAPAGGEQVEVRDAVARRVPILPGVGTASDPEEIAANEEAAAATDLALYQVYLSDSEIDRSILTSSGFGVVEPQSGELVAQLGLVPESEEGFSHGDVVDNDGEFEYEADTTFGELTLTVLSGDEPASVQGYDTTEGQVEILHVDDQVLCLDIDVQLSQGGELIYAARGVVSAEVVRAPRSFYFT